VVVFQAWQHLYGAVSRRLFDARMSCWPVIGDAALMTLLTNPALGLLFGWLAEIIRSAIMRRFGFRPDG